MCMKRYRGILSKIYKTLFMTVPLKVHRKLNRNKDFTLISRNCIGGAVYHQYGLQFRSPTINLYIKLDEFNLFCLYLHEYLDGNMKQVFLNDCNYPVGELKPTDNQLPNIYIRFMHYDSFEEALKKWDERKRRINWDNLYIINDCTTVGAERLVSQKVIYDFNRITYPKMIFVNRNYGFCNEYVLCSRRNKILIHPLDKNRYSWKYGFNKFNFNKFLK